MTPTIRSVAAGAGHALHVGLTNVGMSATQVLLHSRGKTRQALAVQRQQAATAPRNGVALMGIGLLTHNHRVTALGAVETLASIVGSRYGTRIGADLVRAAQR